MQHKSLTGSADTSITGLFPPRVLCTDGASGTGRGFTAERIWRSRNDLRPAKHVLQRPFVWLRQAKERSHQSVYLLKLKKPFITHFSPLFLLLSPCPTHTLSSLSASSCLWRGRFKHDWQRTLLLHWTNSLLMSTRQREGRRCVCFSAVCVYVWLNDLNTNTSNMFSLNGVTLLMVTLNTDPSWQTLQKKKCTSS